MPKQESISKRLFVLDTNVMMHDPSCLYRFQEHDVFLPMIVLEELDKNKRGHSEVARNARQASRVMEEPISGAIKKDIEKGIKLPEPVNSNYESGRIFFQTRNLNYELPPSLPGSVPDNNILAAALALQKQKSDARVIIVSKDINLNRIR